MLLHSFKRPNLLLSTQRGLLTADTAAQAALPAGNTTRDTMKGTQMLHIQGALPHLDKSPRWGSASDIHHTGVHGRANARAHSFAQVAHADL